MPLPIASSPVNNFIAKLQHAFLMLGLFCLPVSGFFIPLSVTVTNISMASAVACSVLSGQFFKKYREVKTNPLVISILMIFIFAVFATFWSSAPWNERLSVLHKYDKLLYFIFLIPLCLEKRWRDRAINAFLMAMILTVCISFLKQYAGLALGNHPNDAAWVFHSHIETSYFVAFSAYIFIYRAINSDKARWLYVALFFLFTWQEFFINDGRTGWVIYLVLVIMFFGQIMLKRSLDKGSQSLRQKIIPFVKGVFVGMLASFFLAVLFYTFSSSVQGVVGNTVERYITFDKTYSVEGAGEQPPIEGHQKSIKERWSFVKASIILIKQHPLIGVGTGAFRGKFEEILGVSGWGHPHNEYLLTLINFGLIGLLLLLYFFLCSMENDFPMDRRLASGAGFSFVIYGWLSL